MNEERSRERRTVQPRRGRGVGKGLSVVALALLALGGSPVFAHHILGIPHYKYSDVYPQIPYLEVVAQVGAWDVLFTHFPGFPEPGESVRLKIYVHDRGTGEVFREPMRVDVLRKRFLRASVPAAESLVIHTGEGPERNDYKFYLTFPEREAYEVLLHFPTAEGEELIPFPVTVGRTDDRPLLFGAVGVLGLAVVGVAVTKKRRRRRR